MASKWVVAQSTAKMLQWWGRVGTQTQPAAFYLAFSATTADPAAGAFTDISVTNYARQSITWSYSLVGSTPTLTNTAQINFNNLGATTLVGQGIFDAVTAGNLLAWADIANGTDIAASTTVFYPAGSLVLNLVP